MGVVRSVSWPASLTQGTSTTTTVALLVLGQGDARGACRRGVDDAAKHRNGRCARRVVHDHCGAGGRAGQCKRSDAGRQRSRASLKSLQDAAAGSDHCQFCAHSLREMGIHLGRIHRQFLISSGSECRVKVMQVGADSFASTVQPHPRGGGLETDGLRSVGQGQVFQSGQDEECSVDGRQSLERIARRLRVSSIAAVRCGAKDLPARLRRMVLAGRSGYP